VDTESDVLCLIIGLVCVLFGVASAFIRRDRYAYALPSDKPSGGTVAGVLAGLALELRRYDGVMRKPSRIAVRSSFSVRQSRSAAARLSASEETVRR